MWTVSHWLRSIDRSSGIAHEHWFERRDVVAGGGSMLWIVSAHVVSVIAWMAALLYLPRLMVYHADASPGSAMSETFKTMERRLLRGIATPALGGSWLFGGWLAVELRAWNFGWFRAKLVCVVALTVLHMMMAAWVKTFARDRNTRTARFYRIVNEAPTLLMIAIVVLVIVKPF
jgi:putative membrane protein